MRGIRILVSANPGPFVLSTVPYRPGHVFPISNRCDTDDGRRGDLMPNPSE